MGRVGELPISVRLALPVHVVLHGSAMPTGGTTSTASPMPFPGLSSEVSSSSAVVVVKLNFTRAGHRIVLSTLG